MNYDELLNHKSILDCENEKDIEQHDKDVQKMYEILNKKGKYGAIVKFKHMDLAHSDKKERYGLVSAEDYQLVTESLDIKDGGDFVIHNGDIGIAVYGSNYTMGNKDVFHLVETLVTFRFFNEEHEKTFEELHEKIEELSARDEQELLSKAFREEYFINNEELKNELRDTKKIPLEHIIENAQKYLEEEKRRKEEKKKEKNRGKNKKEKQTHKKDKER